MNKTRGVFGADLVEMKESFRHIVSTKDQCKIIGLLADQSPVKNESNYWTTFLNQETSVYLGPEKISEKMNYPVLFCSMNKVKRILSLSSLISKISLIVVMNFFISY